MQQAVQPQHVVDGLAAPAQQPHVLTAHQVGRHREEELVEQVRAVELAEEARSALAEDQLGPVLGQRGEERAEVHGLIPADPGFHARRQARHVGRRGVDEERVGSLALEERLVVGHLRTEKDPFRAALAARRLPPASRVTIVHLGGAHDPAWAETAEAEMRDNPRYVWLGDLPAARVRRLMARARLMVLSSIMEGGANVISEALVSGLPVLASRIDGSVGLLGEAYPGYFPVSDTAALAVLLDRAEREPGFLASLDAACAARAPLFTPERERASLGRLLAELA